METTKLLLETSKNLNSSLARGNYKNAYKLLQIANSLRLELGKDPLSLPALEERFK